MKSLSHTAMALCLSTVLLGSIASGTPAQTAAGKKPAAKTAPKTKKAVAEVKYQAQCGMVYSAADARKYHYVCPMDHKPLTKIASSKVGQKTK